jgi:uncharacterized membrane protein
VPWCSQCGHQGRIPEDTNSGLPTYGIRKDSLRTRHSLLSQILFVSFAPPPSLHRTEHVYIHTDRLYMNYRETFLHRSERCEVLTGYLSLGRRSGGAGPIRDIGQNVLLSAFEQDSAAALLLPCFVTYCISWGGLYWRYNTVIILRTDYIIITGIRNNNIAVIDNNYGRLQDLILLFKFPMVTRNYFLEICRQFVLRTMVNAPWYVPNKLLHTDLQMSTIREEITKFNP